MYLDCLSGKLLPAFLVVVDGVVVVVAVVVEVVAISEKVESWNFCICWHSTHSIIRHLNSGKIWALYILLELLDQIILHLIENVFFV